MPGYIEEYVWRRRNLVLHDSDAYRLAFLKKNLPFFLKKIPKNCFFFLLVSKAPP
jgi:hypothetical protein